MIDLRKTTFLKPVVIQNERATFRAQGRDFHLSGGFFKGFDGKTVLINSALEVFYCDKKLGNAVPV